MLNLGEEVLGQKNESRVALEPQDGRAVCPHMCAHSRAQTSWPLLYFSVFLPKTMTIRRIKISTRLSLSILQNKHAVTYIFANVIYCELNSSPSPSAMEIQPSQNGQLTKMKYEWKK